MLRLFQGVKSGDGAKLRKLGPLFLDDFLRIIEAAAALRLVTHARVSGFRRVRALAGAFADFLFTDDVARTNDHRRDIAIMRLIRN